METGPSANPYEAPKAALHVEPPSAVERALASRWQRLGGALLDGLVVVLASVPLLFVESLFTLARGNAGSGNPLALWLAAGGPGTISLALLLGIFVLQIALIVKRGQTVGKIVAGTRIVKVDGSPVGFVSGVLLRAIVPQVIGFIPLLGGLFRLVDVLSIFGADKRCVHDLIAGTKVVNVLDG